MKKQILAVVAMICILLCGCGSNAKTNASAGEINLKESSTGVTGDIESESNTKKIKTVNESTSQVSSTVSELKTNEITQANTNYVDESQIQVQPPKTDIKEQDQEAQPEAKTHAMQPQPEAKTQAEQPQTKEQQPRTEASTQPQKTQAKYLSEFKQNYLDLRKSLYGNTTAGNPKWNDTLYRIAKLRADEIVGYNFGHNSLNGYRNGYNTLECISQSPGYTGAWDGWCQSSDHYQILCHQQMDMYAVAVGEGGCVFLTASSKDWNGDAYASTQTAINEKEAKELAIKSYGANENNWKQVLENEVLWQICKDEEGNERFGITYNIYINEYWQTCFNWFQQYYGEQVIK